MWSNFDMTFLQIDGLEKLDQNVPSGPARNKPVLALVMTWGPFY